jgi:hypothetical protein
MTPQLQVAIDQIIFARKYTSELLDATTPADWFRMPAESVSHIAWQVGHLAMAEYRLVLERVRGRQPGDELLISELFLMQFGRDSVPEPDPAKNPSLEEIRHSFDAVHRQALHELPQLADDELSEPPLKPHKLFTTKLGGLFWCSQHEMLHAGQLGLLRRLLGQKHLW